MSHLPTLAQFPNARLPCPQDRHNPDGHLTAVPTAVLTAIPTAVLTAIPAPVPTAGRHSASGWAKWSAGHPICPTCAQRSRRKPL